MKPIIIKGCKRCGGTLAQEEYTRTPTGYSIEFACTNCGGREYREVKSLDDVKLKHY